MGTVETSIRIKGDDAVWPRHHHANRGFNSLRFSILREAVWRQVRSGMRGFESSRSSQRPRLRILPLLAEVVRLLPHWLGLLRLEGIAPLSSMDLVSQPALLKAWRFDFNLGIRRAFDARCFSIAIEIRFICGRAGVRRFVDKGTWMSQSRLMSKASSCSTNLGRRQAEGFD